MRRALIGCAAALALGVAFADGAPDPHAAVIECGRHAPHASGLDAIEEACPDLVPVLEQSGLHALLHDDSGDKLTLPQLESALRLLSAQPGAGTVHLDTKQLTPVLDQLGIAHSAPSWWERIREWLYAHLLPHKGDSNSSWLGEWLSGLSLPQATLAILLRVLFVLIVGAAIWVVVRELRAYGLFGGSLKRSPERWRDSSDVAAGGDATLASVLAAPAARRGALLFELLLDALTTSGRVTGLRARTHRELAREPPFAGADAQAQFAELARVAEQQLFDSAPVAGGRLEAAVVGGASLYESVRGSGRVRP